MACAITDFHSNSRSFCFWKSWVLFLEILAIGCWVFFFVQDHCYLNYEYLFRRHILLITSMLEVTKIYQNSGSSTSSHPLKKSTACIESQDQDIWLLWKSWRSLQIWRLQTFIKFYLTSWKSYPDYEGSIPE